MMPGRELAQMLGVCCQRLVDKHRQAHFYERVGALEMFLADVRSNDRGIDMADDILRIRDDVLDKGSARNVTCPLEVFAPDMGYLGAFDSKCACGLRSKVFCNHRVAALFDT